MANHEVTRPAFIDKHYVQMVLRKGLEEAELQVEKMKTSRGSSVGEGYTTVMLRITAYIADSRIISMIAKLNPESQVCDILGSQIDLFRNESLYYDVVLPILTTFSDVDTIMPIQYHVDFVNNAIVMEDLKEQGFRLQPRAEFLDKSQAILVMKALGKLHGSHYQLLQQDPSMKESFSSCLWNSQKDGVCSKIIENGCDTFCKWLETYDLPSEWLPSLRDIKKRLEKEWFKVCEHQEGRFNVLCHGDCHMKNMMFHKTDDQVRFFDFQTVCYNSFAYDLQYFFFTSVEAEVVVDNLDYLLGCYYKQLMETAPQIPDFSFDRLKFEFAELDYFGFIIGLIFRAHFGVLEAQDAEELLTRGAGDRGFNNPTYRENLLKFLPYFEKAGVFRDLGIYCF